MRRSSLPRSAGTRGKIGAERDTRWPSLRRPPARAWPTHELHAEANGMAPIARTCQLVHRLSEGEVALVSRRKSQLRMLRRNLASYSNHRTAAGVGRRFGYENLPLSRPYAARARGHCQVEQSDQDLRRCVLVNPQVICDA